MTEIIRQAVIVSDLHSGCRFGLCPPRVSLDEGGAYTPSKLQKKVWGMWEEFWGEWVPKVTRGEPWALVINGDAMDGVHHGVNTLISSNLADQKRIAYECLKPHCEDAAVVYFVRGTEAHAGASGENEEKLAESLGCKQNSEGRFSRFELRLKIGHALVDIQHHTAVCGAAAYETTALQRTFVMACEEAGRWGYEAPDIVVRSHRHRMAETRVPTRNAYGISMTTCGWQLKSPLVYRMAGAQMAMPQIGGSLVRCGDEESYARHYVRTISRSSIERPTYEQP